MKIKFLFIFVAILLASCNGTATLNDAGEPRTAVVVSFYTLGEFAQHVGGNKIDVQIITPSSTEPHEYEPTPADIQAIQKSKLFIYNGAGLDPWAQDLALQLGKSGIPTVNMSQTLRGAIPADPHFWLDPVIAQNEVEAIRDALIKIDSQNARYYTELAEYYTGQLVRLHEKFARVLSQCRVREAIVSHNAFAYIGKRYNLNFISVSGISPEDEPSLSRMVELVKIAKEKKLRYVFFETLANQKLSETIAREAGAQTLVLNPIEGLTEEEEADGKDYIALMEENLKNLATAHECN